MISKVKYYFFYLEIALKDKDDPNIYGFINVSHISTKRLIEIFKIDIDKDPHILEGYFLTKSIYRKHKSYIKEEIGQVNLDVFEYCLRQYVSDNKKEIRKVYKLNVME
jgi:hypothetical protein